MNRMTFVLAVLAACGSSQPPRHIAVQLPGAATAGVPVEMVVSGTDGGGHAAPLSATIHFSSSDPNAVLPANTAVSLPAAGTQSFSVTLKTSGAQTVTVSAAGDAQDVASATVQVKAAPATRLAVSIPESCPPFHLTVTAADPFGNRDTAWRGKVHLSGVETSLPPDYAFTADDQGQHAFAVSADAFAIRNVIAADADALVAPSAPAAPPGWCGVGPDLGDVYAVVVDPASPTTLYAATFGGMYRSSDGGATWTGLDAGFSGSQNLFSLAAAPGSPSRIFAGAFGGLYALAEDRESWTLLPTGLNPGGEASAIAFDPNRPDVVFVGTGPGVNSRGILRSTDAGRTWAVVNSSTKAVGVRALAIDPVTSVVYAAPGARSTVGGGGVLRSADAGNTWTAAGLSGIQVAALAVSDDGTLYAGSDFSRGLFTSVDGGQTWSPDRFGGAVNGIAAFPHKPGAVVIATPSGAFVSANSGVSWSAVGDGNLLSVALGPEGAPIYAGALSEGVARSDGASSWTKSNKGMRAAIGFALASNPAGTTVYAGTRGGRVFSTVDRGETWTPAVASDGADIEALVIDPANPSTMYASTFGVARSIDSGASWTSQVLPKGTEAVRTVAMDPSAPRTLYVGTQSGILKTTDGGSVWAPAGLSGSWISSIVVDGGAIYANALPGFYKSLDGAATWTRAGAGLPSGALHPLLLAADSTLYAGADSGVYRSTDHGNTFVALPMGTPGFYVLALAADPGDPRVLYAASASTVLKSSDGGASWRDIGAGLPPTPQVRALLVDPSDRRVVYAMTYGMSVYRTTGGGD